MEGNGELEFCGFLETFLWIFGEFWRNRFAVRKNFRQTFLVRRRLRTSDNHSLLEERPSIKQRPGLNERSKKGLTEANTTKTKVGLSDNFAIDFKSEVRSDLGYILDAPFIHC